MNTQLPTKFGKNHKLFILKFQTQNKFYIYSVNSNEIINVKKVIWDVINFFPDSVEKIYVYLRRRYSIEDIKSIMVLLVKTIIL
jgi:hypothetical protein